MPHWNMEYQVLYENYRKNLEVKSGKKYSLPSVKKKHSVKEPLCRVSGEDTRQRINGGCWPLTEASLCQVFWFAECRALGKPPLCRVLVVCRVLSLWHSAK